MPDMIKTEFFRAIKGEINISDFEKWLYKSFNTLELYFPSEIMESLISFNYKQKDSKILLKEFVFSFIDHNDYIVWQVEKLLIEIAGDSIDLVSATRKLRIIFSEMKNQNFAKDFLINWEDLFDDYPVADEYHLWNKEALDVKLRDLKANKIELLNEAKELVDTLKQK